ncbi:MAG: hypothetical protein KR126chlam1_00787 [Chlamydiae bacterium]|nr:hypothetical protein [Chlamydiota bacterium]
MSEPISEYSPIYDKEGPSKDELNLAAELKKKVRAFMQEIKGVLESPSLVDNRDALIALSETVIQLQAISEKTGEVIEGTLLCENLKDDGQIILNILNQSLSIPGAKANISLREAAELFNPKQTLTSDLRNILVSFLQFPIPTEMMVRELEIIHDEL